MALGAFLVAASGQFLVAGVAADTLQRWPELGAQGRAVSTVT